MENHGYLVSNGDFTTIDFPGASLTEARGINDPGQIVGDYTDPTGFYGYLLDSDGAFTTIDFPGATATRAVGINDRGAIVEQYTDTSGNTYGFVATPALSVATSFTATQFDRVSDRIGLRNSQCASNSNNSVVSTVIATLSVGA